MAMTGLGERAAAQVYKFDGGGEIVYVKLQDLLD